MNTVHDNFKNLLIQAVGSSPLSSDDCDRAFEVMLSGKVEPVQIAAFLTALKIKQEQPQHLLSLARALKTLQKEVMIKDQRYLVDLCGTGGDGAGLFNISTAASFVAACCGAKVAKHGNRGISSSTGSADVLETLGAVLDLSPNKQAQCLEQTNMMFMFAPLHHHAVKHVGQVRKLLGFRTLFNLVGPLVNPACPKQQLIGVPEKCHIDMVAEVAVRLGAAHVMVVHSEDGLNEISLSAGTWVCEYNVSGFHRYQISPEDFGMQRISLTQLKAQSPEQSAQILRQSFLGQHQAGANIIALNAGAGLYVSGVSKTIKDGVEKAKQAISSGAALEKLEQFVNYTKQL